MGPMMRMGRGELIGKKVPTKMLIQNLSQQVGAFIVDKTGLNGDSRIDGLTAPRSGRRRMPCGHGLLGEPHRETPPLNQRGIVFRPVRHPVSGPGDLVAAPSSNL